MDIPLLPRPFGRFVRRLLCLTALPIAAVGLGPVAVSAQSAAAPAAQPAPKPRPALRAGGTGPVMVGEISGEIGRGLVPYVERLTREADQREARALVVRLNTLGGEIGAALEMKRALLAVKAPVIVYIEGDALSAGALLALTGDRIVMAPGSEFGASQVVSGSGDILPEKYQSGWREALAATAEARGRDPRVARAMNLQLDTITEIGDTPSRLVTLTPSQAMTVGYAEAVSPTLNGALATVGLAEAPRETVSPGWAERLIGFLALPAVASLLMGIGLAGLFLELKAPGHAVAGTVGVIALALFFGSHWLVGLATYLDVILFVGGVALLILEIFVIPGFGVAGVLGILGIVSGLFLALVDGGTVMPTLGQLVPAMLSLIVSLVLAIGLVYSLARWLPKTDSFGRLVLAASLQTDREGRLSRAADVIGRTGRTLTVLRPTGLVSFGENDRVDAISEGGFIPAGTAVEVVRVASADQIVVRPTALA